MARLLHTIGTLRYTHDMVRGDGGRTGSDDDKDRTRWRDLMERAFERFGGRAQAWVLMGNHMDPSLRSAIQGSAHGLWPRPFGLQAFRPMLLLLETPVPNLVAGMKGLPGVSSQALPDRRTSLPAKPPP